MYIILSAAKNIRRYAGRYTLFGILLFFVLAIGTISHIASYTAKYEANQLIQKYGATVIVTKNLSTPYPEDLTQIADFPQVQEMQTPRFFFKIIPSSVNIDGVTLNKDNIPSENRFKLYSKGVDLYTDLVNCSLRIEGIDFSIDPQVNLLSASDFIKEGRLPTENNEVSLDVDFCTLIGISVKLGSVLTISFGESEYTYTVVGFHSEIYGQSFNGDNTWCPIIMSLAPADTFRQNGTLDAYYQNIQPIIEESYKALGKTPPRINTPRYKYHTQLLLTSSSIYHNFEEALEKYSRETGISYLAYPAYKNATQLVKAYESTAQICTFFLTAVIAISAAVILIMTALAMHERRYEIGVLLSVGMGKGRIALLFAVENLIFTLGVTILAYAVGLIAAPAAADKLLKGVVTISRAAAALPVAVRMLALAVGLSLPASLISSLAILRYKPMTILRSRS